MGIRFKLFLVFFVCGLAPMLLSSIFNYWSGTRAVETMLRNDIGQDAAGITRDVEASLDERERDMLELARARSMRDYVGRASKRSPEQVESINRTGPVIPALNTENATTSAAGKSLPEILRAEVNAFFQNNRKYYATITCLDIKGQPLFKGEMRLGQSGEQVVHFETENFLPGRADLDESVWTVSHQTAIRSPIVQGQTSAGAGPVIHYTIPVFVEEEGTIAARGALLVDMKLDALFKDAANGRATLSSAARPSDSTPSRRLIIVLDHNGRIIYHTNEVLSNQSVSGVLPFFKPVADVMTAGESGDRFYDSSDGHRWLAVYLPFAPLNLSVAVTGDETVALGSLRRTGWRIIALSALIGLVAALVLVRIASRTARSIERVTEGAMAIAGGKLDQRIEVQSSDETRLLAETFNQMTERLREQMARESETRQFQSFMRISAMLTHDLKNSISALSLLVSNMERQFDREEFRADAMDSLKAATDKLRGLVAKLSTPVETLSGEYKLPRPHDLVPIIKRVMTATAEPVRSLHEIETSLPPSLIVPIDAERIEKVVENLVLNAVEAMGTRRGKLTVVAGEAGEREVFFSVADTGPGMTEEFQRTKLFRPFSTTKSKGVGLGLYTCREVVRAHGGHIDVESQKGVGTCFRVVLPLDQKITGVGERGSRETKTSTR